MELFLVPFERHCSETTNPNITPSLLNYQSPFRRLRLSNTVLQQSVDMITCVCFVLVIGFCVDYCVHIAHAFLVSKGSRKERATDALTEVSRAD